MHLADRPQRAPAGSPATPPGAPMAPAQSAGRGGWLAALRGAGRALRPRQWTKNALLFVALAFTLNLQHPALLLRTVAAFACFCALSSAGYIVNDVADVEADRHHPTKRFRPIA